MSIGFKYYGASFGSLFRGFRLGYGWSAKYQCFIRLSPAGNLYRMEVAPNEGIPGKTASEEYLPWWEKSPDIIDLIVPLRDLKVTKYQVLYLDNDGERISENDVNLAKHISIQVEEQLENLEF